MRSSIERIIRMADQIFCNVLFFSLGLLILKAPVVRACRQSWAVTGLQLVLQLPLRVVP